MASSDATERFAASASELGIEVAVRRYPEGTRTAVAAAAAVGCDVDQIVKSLVLMAGDQPILVLCSGANRVDLAKVGAEFDGKVRMANADEVRAAAGRPDSVFPLTPEALVAGSTARPVDIAT